MSFGGYTATYDYRWAPGDPDHLGPKGIKTVDGRGCVGHVQRRRVCPEVPRSRHPLMICISGDRQGQRPHVGVSGGRTTRAAGRRSSERASPSSPSGARRLRRPSAARRPAVGGEHPRLQQLLPRQQPGQRRSRRRRLLRPDQRLPPLGRRDRRRRTRPLGDDRLPHPGLPQPACTVDLTPAPLQALQAPPRRGLFLDEHPRLPQTTGSDRAASSRTAGASRPWRSSAWTRGRTGSRL